MKKDITIYPSNNLPLDMQVKIDFAKPLGLTASVVVHEVARKLPLFNHSINCESEGQTKDNKKIMVNTVGRWLFGVPGYSGRVRIVPELNNVLIYYPKKSPSEVHKLVESLKREVESKN